MIMNERYEPVKPSDIWINIVVQMGIFLHLFLMCRYTFSEQEEAKNEYDKKQQSLKADMDAGLISTEAALAEQVCFSILFDSVETR